MTSDAESGEGGGRGGGGGGEVVMMPSKYDDAVYERPTNIKSFSGKTRREY